MAHLPFLAWSFYKKPIFKEPKIRIRGCVSFLFQKNVVRRAQKKEKDAVRAFYT